MKECEQPQMPNNMKMVPLQFEDLVLDDVTKLWCTGASEKGWPEELTLLESFQKYVTSGTVANQWGQGQMKGIFSNGNIIGFSNLHKSESGLFSERTPVVEGGTYLLPNERGKGWNRHIKDYLVKTAFDKFACTWCVFCIPENNGRAISAMDKLLLPFERVTLQHTRHPLYKYLKWKTWKQNKPFILYGIHEEIYKNWPTV